MGLFRNDDTEDSPELGQRAKDRISGFEGIITDIAHHISGCERYGLYPSDRDNTADRGEQEWFYAEQLDVIETTTELSESASDAVTDVDFGLGDRVEDDITGFEGVVTTLTFDMMNCPKAAVQPTDHADHTEVPDREWFDAPRLDVLDGGISADYETLVNNPIEQETGPAGDDKPTRKNKP